MEDMVINNSVNGSVGLGTNLLLFSIPVILDMAKLACFGRPYANLPSCIASDLAENRSIITEYG